MRRSPAVSERGNKQNREWRGAEQARGRRWQVPALVPALPFGRGRTHHFVHPLRSERRPDTVGDGCKRAPQDERGGEQTKKNQSKNERTRSATDLLSGRLPVEYRLRRCGALTSFRRAVAGLIQRCICWIHPGASWDRQPGPRSSGREKMTKRWSSKLKAKACCCFLSYSPCVRLRPPIPLAAAALLTRQADVGTAATAAPAWIPATRVQPEAELAASKYHPDGPTGRGNGKTKAQPFGDK